MSEFLVVSIIGDDRAGLVEEISRVVLETGCNIEDSRMSVLGGSFAIIQLVSGQWNTISKLETALSGLQREHGLSVLTKRTHGRHVKGDFLPYIVEVVGLDHPGIVHELASFLASRGINIEDLTTTNQPAAHTGTPIYAVHITIGVPGQQSIATLREDFMELCDRLNLDGVIEPAKR